MFFSINPSDGALTALTDYPGLKIEYSLTRGSVWLPYSKEMARVPPGITALLRAWYDLSIYLSRIRYKGGFLLRSADGNREGRSVYITFKI